MALADVAVVLTTSVALSGTLPRDAPAKCRVGGVSRRRVCGPAPAALAGVCLSRVCKACRTDLSLGRAERDEGWRGFAHGVVDRVV